MKTQTVKFAGYNAFGFTIHSEFPLPELHKPKGEFNQADIIIMKRDLTQRWNQLAMPNSYYVINEDLIMFLVPKVAMFSIEEGKRIIVSPLNGADEDEIRLYTLGTCMGAILIQRKMFPLHGSAIAIEGKAYAIVGDSGAGKSTLASAFVKQGYKLLSDDVIALSFLDENIPYVIPSYPQQKLWEESLKEFEMESEKYRPLFGRETKYSVPVPKNFYNEALPLAGIFELIKIDGEDIEIHPISGIERLNTLFRNTYRNFFINPLGLMEWHFNYSTQLIKHIQLYQLKRPPSYFTAHELVTVIMKTIFKECK